MIKKGICAGATASDSFEAATAKCTVQNSIFGALGYLESLRRHLKDIQQQNHQ
jgi:hypothetical protein